jgi:hypothetical protein
MKHRFLHEIYSNRRSNTQSHTHTFSLRRQLNRQSAIEGPLAVAIEVAPVADAEDIAVALVEANPVGDPGVRPVPALDPTVDDVGDHAVPWRAPAGRPVRSRGRPLPRDHGVARRLVVPRVHPEPQRCLEGYHGVRRDEVRVIEEVHADGSPRRAVVVVA